MLLDLIFLIFLGKTGTRMPGYYSALRWSQFGIRLVEKGVHKIRNKKRGSDFDYDKDVVKMSVIPSSYLDGGLQQIIPTFVHLTVSTQFTKYARVGRYPLFSSKDYYYESK